jgi:phosphoglycolate phosphatase
MTLPAPTIVLFDMDGTTVRHVNPRLLGTLEVIDDVIYKASGLVRRARHEAPISETLGKPPRLIVHRILHKIRRKPVEQIVQPCPGIFSLLNLFKDHGVPMGIVSNGLGKGYGHDILKKFKLDDYFSSQTFREDITHSKPHPEPIIRALRKIKDPVAMDDVVWYIGDRHKDVMAAVAAQKDLPGKIIPFAYGLKASVAVLERGLSPDHIIMNYAEFTQRIKPLFGTDDYRAQSSTGS